MSFLRVLLIEDEAPAMAQLERLLERIFARKDGQALAIVGRASSCAEAIALLQPADSAPTGQELADSPAEPDLILCDIQLGDGSALTIFDVVTAPAPVVFCTAYDQFVLEALRVGGVDYLLKPLREEHLERALDKLATIERAATKRAIAAALRETSNALARPAPAPTQRFVVRKGADFVAVSESDVAYFVSEHKLTLLVQRSGETAYVDESLAKLEDLLAPPDGGTATFFRANRAVLVSRNAVESFRLGVKGRLQLKLTPEPTTAVKVSAQSAAGFKRWFATE